MPKDLSKFGTKDFMVHPSAIRLILTCPWQIVLQYLEAPEESSGPAADTGSAMHKAASAFHDGKSVSESLGVMQAKVGEYPLASLAEAAQMFLSYAADSRNVNAKCVLKESEIRFTITPHETDPTQEGIEVTGTCDQVRVDEWGRHKCYDIKTSKRPPQDVRLESMFQMAAYCIGATLKLGREVQPGAIITPRFYKNDPSTSNVFHPFNFTLSDTELMLEPLRLRVAEIRRAAVYHMPTVEGCKWCHQRLPDLCLPKLAAFKRSLL